MDDSPTFAGAIVIYTEVGNSKCAKGRDILNRQRLPYIDVSFDTFPQYAQQIFDRTGTHILPQIFFNNIYIGHETDLERLIFEKNKWDSLIEMVRREKVKDGPIIPDPMNAMGYEEYETENNNKIDDIIWIPDAYSKLVRDMKKAQLIKNNRINFHKTYKNSFKGEELVEWLMIEKGIKRSEALEIGQELIDRHVGQQTSKEVGMTFSPDRYYQLVEDDENKPLNAPVAPPISNFNRNGDDDDDDVTKKQFSIQYCNDMMIKLLKPIYADILFDEDKSIKYKNLSSNENFNRYITFCRELDYLNFNESTIEDRMAFFINIYNIILIHITLKHGPPQSIWQRRKLINGTYYTIGGHKYALHSIINGILRGNRKGPGMLWKAFGKQDSRLPLVLPQCDPLIHFGLCTGSKTTPPLKVYSSKTIHQELRQNAKTTLLHGDKYLRIDTKKNVIHLGKTFKWFADDFGGTKEKILQWILDVLSDDESDKKLNLQNLFFTGEYSIEYIPFDWSSNGKELIENSEQST